MTTTEKTEYDELEVVFAMWNEAAKVAKTHAEVPSLCTPELFDKVAGHFNVDEETKAYALEAANDMWEDIGRDSFWEIDSDYVFYRMTYADFCKTHGFVQWFPEDHPEPKEIAKGEWWATDSSIQAIGFMIRMVEEGKIGREAAAVRIRTADFRGRHDRYY